MQTFRQVKPAQTGSGINKAEFAEVVNFTKGPCNDILFAYLRKHVFFCSKVCKKFGMTFTPEEVDAFYDKFDDDKSGEIDYVEFCK